MNRPRVIPGVMDYALLAQKHRPTDQTALRAEVCRLATTGLKPIDIATALRLDLAAVLEMLRA